MCVWHTCVCCVLIKKLGSKKWERECVCVCVCLLQIDETELKFELENLVC